MANEYDIRAVIRNILKTTDLVDPGDIADVIVRDVPESQLRPVLTQVLRVYVRVAMKTVGDGSLEEESDPTSTSPKANVKQVQNLKHSGPARTRRAWEALLRQPVAVNEKNQWKKFGDCTAIDLLYLVGARKANAQASLAAAVRFEKYHRALVTSGVDTVSQLSQDVIRQIEEGE